MKKTRGIFIKFLLIFVLATFLLTGCGDGEIEQPTLPSTFTITFDSDGGSAVEDKLATYDQEFVLPSEPTKTGYNFDG